MPFCTNCGKQVGDRDQFCAGCGANQGVVPGPNKSAASDFLGSMDPHTASILCYIPVVGWIPSIVFLVADRFRNDRRVRFNAFQSLYLFVAWLILDWSYLPFVNWDDRWHLIGLFKAAVFCMWIFMLIKTARREVFHLPIFGELADKSLNEFPKKP
jgi:uncharacterized membrane protein